ncbi:MAG: ectonucleotide pyrophosphatase/phosphodiesterase [Longimicrobiales bacterium]
MDSTTVVSDPTRRRRRAPSALLVVLAMATGACGGQPDGGPGAAAEVAVRGSGGVNAEVHQGAPHLVLISFDGFRHDYMDRYAAPNFQRVAAAGVRADRLIPVFPTKTFPTHYSVATGMYAENHGIVGNTFWDPARGAEYELSDRDVVEDGTWYRGEPIWVTAERQGMVSAAYFFVGTEADVMGVRPTHWRPYDGRVSRNARVDQALAWLADDPASRPHVITLYFSDVDDAGHTYGPDSPETGAAVAEVDAALGRLLDGIEALPHGDQVYVVLTSDHGMMPAPGARAEGLDLDVLPGVRMITSGPYASLFVDEGGASRAPALRDSIAAMLPHGAVYLRADVPERFHYSADPRIGDLVVIMEPEWTVVRQDRLPVRDSYTHGWDNRTLGMGGIFLAMGPGIAGGQRIEAFESIHIYPLMAHVLGLTPNPEADGSLQVLLPVLAGR